MSFYRIYRPQVIDEIDNALVKEALLRLLDKPKKDLPHAFLFSGPRGSGKTTAARVVAKIFNCTSPQTHKGPCGKCDQCLSIAAGTNLDILEMDAASNRGIDEIRTLREGIHLTPSGSQFKVYIIDEVHMLTTEAFNALLKTIEEPPSHAVFVLATTDPQKIPATVKSRCVSLVFTKASQDELMHALKRIVVTEKIHIADDALALIAGSVDGSFRDGVKFLEQVSFHKGNITPDVVRSILAITTEESRQTFLQFLAEKNAKGALTVIDRIIQEGNDIRTFVVSCLSDLEKMLIGSVTGKLSGTWNRADLVGVIQILSDAYVEIKGSAITQLPLEVAVVEYCETSVAEDPSASPQQGSGQALGASPQSPSAILDKPAAKNIASVPLPVSSGALTLEKLTEHWADVIASLKPYNHSVAGVMRSTRPKGVADGIVTIEAFYTFHKDKLSEGKTRNVLADVIHKLFGEKVKIEIVLGKK